MKKEKKQLTIKEQAKRYKTYQYLMFGGEYVALLVPYGIMAIVNAEEWFILNPEPWKIGLGGSIGLVVLSLATFLISRQHDNEKLTNGMVAMLIMWYAVTFVFFLLAQINMEIYKIMAYGGLGLMAAVGLEVGSRNFKKKRLELEKAMSNAQENLQTEQATREILEKETKKDKKKIAID